MKNLYSKMLAVQRDVRPIEKNEDNPYFKSKYFSIDTVIAELRPLLNKHGLVVVQPLGIDPNGQPLLRTCLFDPESGEGFETATPLPQNPDPQKQGAVCTYFRRYALVSMFLLQGEFDDDANSASGKAADRPAQGFRPTGNPAKDKIIGTILALEPEKRLGPIANLERTGDWTTAELEALRTRPRI